MNTISIAFTRPRSESGVTSGAIVDRSTMLAMSTPPLTASATIESQSERESPKTTIATPKAPTTSSSVRPA